MQLRLRESRVAGRARAPSSKSYTHRAILAAGYGAGGRVRAPLDSADTRATMAAVEAFGGSVERDRTGETLALEITGFEGAPAAPAGVIDCANSGTTMRLTTAAAALNPGLAVLTGDESLRSRPQQPLLDGVRALGGRAESTRANGQAPLVVGGPIEGGRAVMPGDVSSQFVTALLMAGGVTDSGIEITLETALKSAPYVAVTREVLEAYGIDTEETGDGFSVRGGQTYAPEGGEYTVPGDFSSISYLLAAGVLAAEDGQTVTVEGASPSAQGDTKIVDILDRMGATIEWDRQAGEIHVERSELSGIEVSVVDTPDLLPTIATLGAAASGSTRIVECEHVRYKETDRVAAMAAELSTLGASVTERQDTLIIDGDGSALVGDAVDGRGDHRLVMALSIAGLVAEGSTTVAGAEHVDVSFPAFFETLAALGAAVEDGPPR